MDCYVESGYWDAGYTEQDVCGIAPAPDAPIGGGGTPGRRVYRDARDFETALRKAVSQTVDDAPEELRQEVKEAVARIEDLPLATVDLATMDALIADMQAVAAMLPAIQSDIIAEWTALAYDIAQRAEEERDIEMLLLLA